MALIVPTFSNPFNPPQPLTNAYAWISGLFLDLASGQGRVVLNVNPSPEAWQAVPVAQVSVSMGDTMIAANPDSDPPTEAVVFPTLPELLADPEFAQAYTTIGQRLYSLLAEQAPVFVGSIVELPGE